MKQKERLNQIQETLVGQPAPKKRVLASRLGISIGTLNRYLALLKKEKKIAYMRSRDDKNKTGSTYVVIR